MTPHLADTPVLETERLTLRAPDLTDWDGYRALMASDASKHAGGPAIRPRAWHSFAGHLGHWALRGFGLFSVRTRDEASSVGMVGPYYPEGWPEPELGWILWPGETGQGFATEAVTEARRYARAVLDWTDIVSYIHPDNAASIRVAERLGCTRDRATRGLTEDDPALVYRHPAPEALA